MRAYPTGQRTTELPLLHYCLELDVIALGALVAASECCENETGVVLLSRQSLVDLRVATTTDGVGVTVYILVDRISLLSATINCIKLAFISFLHRFPTNISLRCSTRQGIRGDDHNHFL